MENQPNNPTTPSQNIRPRWWILIAIIFLILLFINSVFMLYLFKTQLETPPQTPNQQINNQTVQESDGIAVTENTSPTMKPTTTPILKWKNTSLLGKYSLDYPEGWHVASLWPDTYENPIRLVIDPEPIDTAPRGGPAYSIELSDWSGSPSPSENFAQEKQSIVENLQPGYKENPFSSEAGEGVHYIGKISGEYMSGQYMEIYIIFIDEKNDPLNSHLLTLSTYDEQYSNHLKHIAESIKLNW